MDRRALSGQTRKESLSGHPTPPVSLTAFPPTEKWHGRCFSFYQKSTGCRWISRMRYIFVSFDDSHAALNSVRIVSAIVALSRMTTTGRTLYVTNVTNEP